jgi:hypothetical protein
MKQLTYRQMGLSDEEFQQVETILGREPNYLETGMFAVLVTSVLLILRIRLTLNNGNPCR